MRVRGCFSYNCVGDLYGIKDTLTEQKYHSTLERHVILSGITFRRCGNQIPDSMACQGVK